MRSIAAVMAASIIWLVSGYAQGVWSGRWVSDAQITQAAADLDQVPLRFGDWEGEKLPTLSPIIRERTGIVGSLSRKYVNLRDGSVASVMLVCGPPGPIATHPPEVCLSGSGFTMVAPPASHHVEASQTNPAATFNAAEFRRDDPDGEARMMVLWAWNGAGAWETPNSPRWTFASRPLLYKLYVMSPITAPGPPTQDQAAYRLLHDLLPQLQPSLRLNRTGPPR